MVCVRISALGIGIWAVLAGCREPHPLFVEPAGTDESASHGGSGTSGATGPTSATTTTSSTVGTTSATGTSAVSTTSASGTTSTSGGAGGTLSVSSTGSGGSGTGGTTGGSTGGGSIGGGTTGGGSNTIFITAFTYPLPFTTMPGQDQLEAADAICQQEADTAGLPGTFVALLQTSAGDGTARLGSAQGWRDPNGRPIVNTPSDLQNEQWLGYLKVDAFGFAVGGDFHWASGSGALTENCQDWTSGNNSDREFTGATKELNKLWTWWNTFCDEQYRLVCASIDNIDPITITPSAQARLVFLSTRL